MIDLTKINVGDVIYKLDYSRAIKCIVRAIVGDLLVVNVAESVVSVDRDIPLRAKDVFLSSEEATLSSLRWHQQLTRYDISDLESQLEDVLEDLEYKKNISAQYSTEIYELEKRIAEQSACKS